MLYLKTIISGRPLYRSCSVFAPLCAPTIAPWTIKALETYFAGGVDEGRSQYDPALLIGMIKGTLNILVDYVSDPLVF